VVTVLESRCDPQWMVV